MGNRASTPQTIGGKVAEVICVRTASRGVREKLEGHLAHKWGISGTLNSTHPHRFFPPRKKLPLNVIALGNKPLGVFSRTINGLQPGTEYQYRFLLKNGAGVGFSPMGSFSTIGVPVMGNSGTSYLSTHSADLLSQIQSNGGDDANVTFFWGDNDGGQIPANWDSNQTLSGERSSGPISLSIIGLQPGTVYYFTVRTENLAGSSWAQSFSFSTILRISSLVFVSVPP